MSEARAGAGTRSIERTEWSAWCASCTAAQSGRVLTLSFIDAALGEVELASEQPLLAIDYDELGSSVAFTIRYGTGVVPINYVIAEPRIVTEEFGSDDRVARLVIEDKTRRRTFVALG